MALVRLTSQQARELRAAEKERYLAADATHTAQRCPAYEDLILGKYLPHNTKPLRGRQLSWRQQVLDRAWIERDLHHTREAQEN